MQLTRKIAAVHVHHTWRPRRQDFRGLATVEAMRFMIEMVGDFDAGQDPFDGEQRTAMIELVGRRHLFHYLVTGH
jgi:hypothetical protein